MLRSAYIRFYISLFGPLIMRLIKLKYLFFILNPLSIKHVRLLSKMHLTFRSTSRLQNNLTRWNCLYYFLFNISILSHGWLFDFNNFIFIFILARSCCHLLNNLNIITILIIFLNDCILNWFYKFNILPIIYNFCLI